MSKIRINPRLALDIRRGRVVRSDGSFQAIADLRRLSMHLGICLPKWTWQVIQGNRPALIGRLRAPSRRAYPSRVTVEFENRAFSARISCTHATYPIGTHPTTRASASLRESVFRALHSPHAEQIEATDPEFHKALQGLSEALRAIR